MKESSDEAGSPWSRASTSRTAATAAVGMSAGEAQPPGFAKCTATQNVDVPVPQAVKEILEVVKPAPRGALTPCQLAELRVLRQYVASFRDWPVSN